MRITTVAFTGHRPHKLGGYALDNPVREAVTAYLRTTLLFLRPSYAISGMALGVDQWAAELCLDLSIPLIAAIPFAEQDRIWPASAQSHYRQLLSQAKHHVIVGGEGSISERLDRRNHWMVDHCDLLLAVWNGSSGGTANCVRYAQSIGRRVTIWMPDKIFFPVPTL